MEENLNAEATAPEKGSPQADAPEAAAPSASAAEQQPADAENQNDHSGRITELEKELESYKDRFVRKMAEFDNYKRRTAEEQASLLKYASEPFIVKLLSVADDFERSLKHIDSATETAAIREGIHLVYDKLMKLFGEQGIKKIEAVGAPFNVEYHEALLQRPAPGVAPHTVLDEVLAGYLYKDKVIRHAQVIVSDDSEETTAPQHSESNG